MACYCNGKDADEYDCRCRQCAEDFFALYPGWCNRFDGLLIPTVPFSGVQIFICCHKGETEPLKLSGFRFA